MAVSGSRITYLGLENIPERGGAVVAINHTSYIDWLPAALAAYKRHRRLRFMIKEEMTQVKVVNFLIKHTGTIPVDRRAGAGAYAVAVERLRAGRARRRVPGGHHQPQLRAQGVQVRRGPDGASKRRCRSFR